MTLAQPRFPGTTYFITTRVERRELRLPPTPETSAGVAVALAEAAEQHQVRIVAASVPGNHLHLVAHDEMGTLSAFMKHAFSVIGRFCNARDRVKGISRVGRPRLLRLTRPRHSSRLVSVVFVTSQA